VIVVVVVILLAVPYIPIAESYTVQETYDRSCAYVVTSANQADGIDWFGKWAYHWIRVNLENTDTKGGIFEVRFYASSTELTGQKTVKHYMGPGAKTEFYADWDTTLFQGMNVQYAVTPPTVQDQATVTKTRIVFKSIIQIWAGA